MQQMHADILATFETAFQKLPFLQDTHNLFKPLHHAFLTSGKRLRPLCSLIVHNSFAPLQEDIITVAIAIELFHNFTLIHDDIIDASELRRGKLSVFRKYGLNASILSGDALLILAYGQIERIHADYKSDILALFNKTAIEVCLGQQKDVDLENEAKPTIEDYIEMVELKTATLIGCAFQMGGIVAKISPKEQACLYKIGEALGVAFQIQDDILDVYGERKKTGKKNSSDILQHKKTILFLEALACASPSQKAVLLDKTKSEESLRIARIMEIYDDLKVREKATRHLVFYEEKCRQSLHKMETPQAAAIEKIIRWIMQRQF